MSCKVLLAPTKSTHLSPKRFQIISTPYFLAEANFLVEQLKLKEPHDLAKLMKISGEIATLTYQRFQKWKIIHGELSFHAIQMYAGEAFKAFDLDSLDEKLYPNLQDSLLIFSGLYGILRPFDLVYPYRLEMGLTYSPSDVNRNLYSFWQDKIQDYFKVNVCKSDLIINLASIEYSKVLDFKKLSSRSITPIFKEYKNGELKMVMMHAKNARGKMARFILENDIKSDEELKNFQQDGYSFDQKRSTPSEWLFIR